MSDHLPEEGKMVRSRRPRLVSLVIVSLVVSFVVAGVASSSVGSLGGAGGQKVFLLGCTNQNPWCSAFNKSLAGGLQKAGVRVTVLTTNFDPVVQAQQAAQAISQRPNAILSHVADPNAAAPWIRRATTAGIKVIPVDTDVGPKVLPLVTANLMPNHCRLGTFAAINIQEGLKKQGVTTGNVILITGTQSQVHVQTRIRCFKAQLAKTSGLKIVENQDGNWDAIKTGTLATQLLAKWRGQGGIQGAYGMADYQAAAIAGSAKQAGVPLFPKSSKGLVVTGSNCHGTGVKAIKAGEMYGGATQSPILEGRDFVPYVVKVLEGEKIGTRITTPVNRLTRATVDKYLQYCNY
jgi:ABC-type sugar transport system substrate-binding protein